MCYHHNNAFFKCPYDSNATAKHCKLWEDSPSLKHPKLFEFFNFGLDSKISMYAKGYTIGHRSSGIATGYGLGG
jgi:hypothetical protein